ncbi:LTA synthase family protein [Flavobacterium sp. N1994]|uniref:LTA synthase family protein n=1 Tax=Flavobacterium sp. N1994 TaxID=2986827 RepID=UPI0022220D3D|nr:LTA synthase family protein [Flavobacterium sp. N1994]
MKDYIRINEYKVLAYRLLLLYLLNTITRILFVLHNSNSLHIDKSGIQDLFLLFFYGLKFDTVSIIYLNILFILFSLIPLKFLSHKKYQRVLSYFYFIPNTIGLIFNCVDIVYYKFTLARSTSHIFESIENEPNKIKLLSTFLVNYWYVYVYFFVLLILWIFLFKKVKPKKNHYVTNAKFYFFSIVITLTIFLVAFFGIRGSLDVTNRPINIIDANNYVNDRAQSDIVLNTSFCVIRTLDDQSFNKKNYVSQHAIETTIQPIKNYAEVGKPFKKMNVVVFILESFGREYLGSFNKDKHIKNYVSYTPFLDSLATKSYIFTNAYSNGVKSIHAMPSVLAGIPSFEEAFTTSPYINTKIESVVSVLNKEGYDTSFFHGAPNGSMSFLGLCGILGFQHYYGLNEYNNNDDFDGVWGIWDHKFFQYMDATLSKKNKPFFATVFSVSSHDPFQVPKEFKNQFKEGDVPLHKCIRYTDYSLKKFFEKASKEKWFSNTIFVITADHCNQIYYDEYFKTLNKSAVPILIYMPGNPEFNGINKDWAQQIDIYPTILDLLDYDKPFRSWGRSLFNTNEVKPFVVNYINNQYQFMYGDYICTFSGDKVTGYYYKTDSNYTRNLIKENRKEFKYIEVFCKSFIQNYYNSIIDRHLDNVQASNLN